MKSRVKILFLISFSIILEINLLAQVNRPKTDQLDLERSISIDKPYELGEYSKRREGVPQGTIEKFTWTSNGIYPGTTRDYWVYVPEQYDSTNSAYLVIFQDGEWYLNGAPWTPGVSPNIVFDNLIQAGEIPVTLGLFINPGDVGPGSPLWGGTGNRSYEYDAVNDLYSRFLLEEIIPELKKNYNITDNPKGRVLVGYSSGGICAFNAAWYRPDKFGNVISHCGSFANVRGGHIYPSLIRRTPKKSIRVYLQAGTQDLDVIFGNWPLINQSMAKALDYAGYDYQFVFGEGGHTLHHGAQLFPETLKWIGRDYPKN